MRRGGLWCAYTDVKLWVRSSNAWWGPLNWENTCDTVFIEGDSQCKGCAIRVRHPSAKSTSTCCCPNRATCIALHPCCGSGAKGRLSPLLGCDSSKAKERTSVFFCEVLARDEESSAHQLKHLHIRTSASSQPASALGLWLDLPTVAPSVLVWLPIWLIPALLPRLAARQRALCWESTNLEGFYWIRQDYNAGPSEEELSTSLLSTIYHLFLSVCLGPTCSCNYLDTFTNAGPDFQPAL